ncbi:hypothetical protein TrVE_jg4485 [Triparma verrucosa]|uniref:STAS domain-containing protein n=1 Tax=Triparma verrucosa TaxID=1606542 RepID=A0A9W6Z8L8_9STRA|nr:hypothetical protein TrVE_jg4485 [Triparma verrucosa]
MPSTRTQTTVVTRAGGVSGVHESTENLLKLLPANFNEKAANSHTWGGSASKDRNNNSLTADMFSPPSSQLSRRKEAKERKFREPFHRENPRTQRDLKEAFTQNDTAARRGSMSWAARHGIKFAARGKSSITNTRTEIKEMMKGKDDEPGFVCDLATLKKFVPILTWLPNYDRAKSLRVDLIAGLVIAFMVIPQGMAYGMLAGMPVEYGLYSSMVPPLLYSIFGGAAHLSLGTNAPISILVADSVTAAIPTDTDCSDDPNSEDCQRILDATLLICLLSGFFYMLFMILRFSIITSFVPDPVLSGFTTGASMIIITSNTKHVFGVTTKRGMIWEVWQSIIEELPNTNWTAFAFFILSYMALLSIKEINRKYKAKMPVPIPEQLVVLVVCTGIVAAFNLDVPKVKDIPSGLRKPQLMNFDDINVLIQPALVCSIVTYILTFNVAKALGEKNGYEVDGDQEFIANSIAAVCGSLTGSYLPSGSFSRSALVGEITGKDGTPLHNVFSVLVVGLVVMFMTPLLYHMPKAIMASIIFVALKNMINIATARKLYKVSKQEWTLWMISFVSTTLLGVTYGILISIVASLGLLVKFQARPATRVMGLLGGEGGLTSKYGTVCLDVKEFSAARELYGIKIFKFEADLHFANKDWFDQKLRKMDERCQWDRLYAVIIDCSAINTIDLTCVKLLERIHRRYQEKNVKLLFANWKAQSMQKVFESSGLYETIGEENFFLKMRGALEVGLARARKRQYEEESRCMDEEDFEGEGQDFLGSSEHNRPMPHPIDSVL